MGCMGHSGNDLTTMNEHEMLQQLLSIKDQAPVQVDAEKCALVVVDVQRFFARPEYAFAQRKRSRRWFRG